MNYSRIAEQPRRLGGLEIAKLCLLVMLPIGALGCDHRISLQEFIEMQQPTTQPAPDRDAKKVRIDVQLGPYKVGPSDVLGVVVIGTKAETLPPVQIRVRRDGTINLPLVGTIKVTDMELEDVEQAVRKAYEAKVYQQAVVHVEAVNVDTTSVLVTGAVTSPGLARLRRNERNLLYAIVAAGGVSSMASGRVTLCRIRRPDERVTLNLTDPKELRKALALSPLENGDVVTVAAAKPNTVFVGGLVNAPMPQVYPPGVQITILQAIAAANGLRTDLIPTEATLIRRINGKDVHVKLNLDRLAKGKDQNITLAAGDILWVPHTFGTRIHEFINKTVSVSAGASYSAGYNHRGAKYYHDLKQQETGYIIGP